jgi:hypothetical protein
MGLSFGFGPATEKYLLEANVNPVRTACPYPPKTTIGLPSSCYMRTALASGAATRVENG